MRTPISYYGGKQNMLKYLLPLIPSHVCYIEPFFGGGSLYWAKEKGSNEVINDTNSEVTNFMNVLKTQFRELQKMLAFTIPSENEYKKSKLIYNNSELFNEVERAWAFFIQTNLSSQSKINAGYGFQKTFERQNVIGAINIKKMLRKAYSERLSHTAIFNRNANEILKTFDSNVAFAYCDPPYFNSDMGHYKGYTAEDYLGLLGILTTFKGKFLLSSYQNDLAEEWAKEKGFTVQIIEMYLSAGNKAGVKQKSKYEMLVYNYEPVITNTLF